MSLATRVIACLDVADGRVVKGVNFKDLRDAGNPVELAKNYNQQGIDELVFLDITASSQNRSPILQVIEETADQVFIPLTVGGGVSTVQQVNQLLRAGADKVSINTAAINNPNLLKDIADRFGAQVIVLSIDTKRSTNVKSGFALTTHGGRTTLNLDLIDWLKTAQEIGIGEVLLNSMDFDGTQKGFDLELIELARNFLQVPIIASGGAGELSHFVSAVKSGASAVLAASLFHFNIVTIPEVKKALSNITVVRN